MTFFSETFKTATLAPSEKQSKIILKLLTMERTAKLQNFTRWINGLTCICFYDRIKWQFIKVHQKFIPLLEEKT